MQLPHRQRRTIRGTTVSLNMIVTDVIHASDATLAILTAKEILEVNQDLGVKGKLQGFHVGPCAAAVPSSRHSDGYDSNVIVTKCDGSTAQAACF